MFLIGKSGIPIWLIFYNVYGMSTIYLLDGNGRVMAEDLRDKELEMKLNELLE